MAYESPATGCLDYSPCRYGNAALSFRGPKRRLTGRFCAVLGGTETYGKFIEAPYPALIEAATGLKTVNLGVPNAGADALLKDRGLLEICARADLTVVQLTGAHNLSNRYYRVHPRRNDRFVEALDPLRSLYGEVDFVEFAFTRHLLTTLAGHDPDRFARIRAELKAVWMARMQSLLARIEGETCLLWLSYRPPAPAATDPGLGPEPLHIDAEMVAAVGAHAARTVEVAVGDVAGTEGMVHGPLETPAAGYLPGPQAHTRIAEALGPEVARLLG